MICDRRCVIPVSGSTVWAFKSPFDFHAVACAPEKYPAAHLLGRLATVVAGSTAASAGHDIHARTVCIPGTECELSKIEPDAKSGVRILGNSLSDSTLHLLPIDGQVEAAIDALASCQEFELSLTL